jgi:hypothetical protein
VGFIQSTTIQHPMTRCFTNDSLPLTTTAQTFTLKPRVEKDNIEEEAFGPSPPFFGRGLRIRSSFDEEDAKTGKGRSNSMVEPAAPPAVTIEPPEWAVRATGEARLEVSTSCGRRSRESCVVC